MRVARTAEACHGYGFVVSVRHVAACLAPKLSRLERVFDLLAFRLACTLLLLICISSGAPAAP